MLTTLAIKEMYIKTLLTRHLTPVRTVTNVGKDVEKKELSYTAGGNVN
jgi:hypothetical protein